MLSFAKDQTKLDLSPTTTGDTWPVTTPGVRKRVQARGKWLRRLEGEGPDVTKRCKVDAT